MIEYAITLENVSKVYPGGYCAFSRLSFSLVNHEKLCVIGKEKDGKTTLIKLVAALEKPSEGKITLNGADSGGIDYKSADIGCILPDMSLKQSQRVYDIMMYPLKIRKIETSLANERVYTTAAQFGIENLLTCKISELSLYHRRLVALARMFAQERRIYLLDNPLEGLGYDERIHLAGVLRDIFAAVPACVIYTCDLIDEAEELNFDIYGVLGYAQMQDVGTLRKLRERPRTLESAKLLYKNRINVIKCPINGETVEIFGVKSEYGFKLMSNVFSSGNLTIPFDAVSVTSEGRYSGKLKSVYNTLKGQRLRIASGNAELECDDNTDTEYPEGINVRFDIDMRRVNIYDISSDNIISRV